MSRSAPSLVPADGRAGMRRRWVLHRRWLAWGALALGWCTSSLSAADTKYVTARLETTAGSIQAYGVVQPITVVPVKVPAPGIVSDFTLVPGASVAAGDTLARLTGPEVDAATAKAQAAIASATARLAAAKTTLAVLEPQLASHLATRQQVAQAQADVADATSARETAKADAATANLAAAIRAPIAGVVVALNAAPGERVATSDTLLTLQPANGLWATAMLYGRDAELVHVGDRGRFTPAEGRPPIDVAVASVAPAQSSDGGVTVGLKPTKSDPEWRSGQYGEVVLDSSPQQLVAVPTQALILDQAKWWVLVRTPNGDKPVEVVPGPAHGWETLLRQGLAPGMQIVAEDAYLEFHQAIASRYQPPD